MVSNEMERNHDNPALTPGTLIDGARMYAAAADAVNDRFPQAMHVLSHLLGMSIELALKAFLRHHGYSGKRLRGLGHDLRRAYKEAVGVGLRYTGSRSFRVGVLGLNYSRRTFAYPERRIYESIAPWSLREVAHTINVEVFAAIKGEAVAEELSAEPGLCVQSEYLTDFDPSAWPAKPSQPPK
jgi:hypothetical protein